MIITRSLWVNIFKEISTLMIDNKNTLSEIDAKFGDGDHGITIEKIGKAVLEIVTNWEGTDDNLKTLFASIGDAVTNIGGGSAGPLYGTYLSGYAEAVNDEVEVDAKLLKEIFKAGLTELQFITKAKVGDKTMMDTLIPATKAVLEASDDVVDIVTKGKDAAVKGAKDSENYVSKFGRARSYKEQTLGTPDAGAVSSSYIFIGFYNALTK